MSRDDRKSLLGPRPLCCFTDDFGRGSGRRVLIGCETLGEG